MRIVHVVSQDCGGAGRACVRLHNALLDSGVDSIVLTMKKTTDIPTIERVAKTKFQKLIDAFRPHIAQIPLLLYPNRAKDIFSPSLPMLPLTNRALIKRIHELKPDVVHLHWIENGFFNISDLCKIRSSMVWSLHDAAAYTGGCHIVAAACVGSSTRCTCCPLLDSKRAFDLSALSFAHKRRTLTKLNNLTIIGLSTWITQCAKESTLLKDKPIINLPNPIDTSIFAPLPKTLARTALHIQSPKHFIAFGALGALSTPRKGYAYLQDALATLKASLKESSEILIFGASGATTYIHGIRAHFLGHLSDDITLRLVYSAATVFVTPSLAESFGQTALESLCCGTPVVCFDTSGLKDIILHKHNGYLARFEDAIDLARGIEWVLSLDASAYEEISHNARQSAIKSFDASTVSARYKEAYKDIIRGGAQDQELAHSLTKQAHQDLSQAYAPQNLTHHLFSLPLLSHCSSAPEKHLAALTLQNLIDHSNSYKKHIIGFGALGGGAVARKGYNELKAALSMLEPSLQKHCEILTFGGYTKPLQTIRLHQLGFIGEDSTLALVYNACTLFAHPSLAENLSNAIMEALSCGTPVVCFDIGGNGDMVVHKHNGYLAKAQDPMDFARGIEWVLSLDASAYEEISHNARNTVLKHFGMQQIARSYKQLYKKLLNSKGGGQHTAKA